MQPLDGAYQRARRARRHLSNLKTRVNRFRREIEQGVVVQRKPQLFVFPDGKKVQGVLGHVSARVPGSADIPPLISILVGETVYNMRAALDYLVYELARLDSNSVQNGTQFPIDDSEAAFARHTNSYLKGLSDKHIAAIELLQPCNGCNWTRTLRAISNPDKHRQLTILHSGIQIALRPGSTEAIIAGASAAVHTGVSARIAFADGQPVLEILEQLIPEITKTLDLFQPEF